MHCSAAVDSANAPLQRHTTTTAEDVIMLADTKNNWNKKKQMEKKKNTRTTNKKNFKNGVVWSSELNSYPLIIPSAPYKSITRVL